MSERAVWQTLRSRPAFWIAAAVVSAFVAMAVVPHLVVAPSPAESSPSGQFCNLAEARQAPSGSHWLGTDIQGCDYFVQVTYGARTSLRVAMGATTVALLIGLVLGGVAGYFGGWLDTLISRVTDGFLAFPALIAAIIVLSTLTGNRERNEVHVLLAIGVLSWPAVVRLFRSRVLQVKSQTYIEAARALGTPSWRILTRHVLPNAIAPVIVYTTMSIGALVAAEATLSFLGAGLPIDAVSWGNMIDDGATRVERSPHLLVVPVVYLVVISVAFVVLGEELRRALDPRERARG
jgi:ABC-type dipeptide/oligopeptide/nickel transport system permease subunit